MVLPQNPNVLITDHWDSERSSLMSASSCPWEPSVVGTAQHGVVQRLGLQLVRGQSRMDKCCMMVLTWGTWSCHIHRDGMYKGGCRRLGGGVACQCLTSPEFQCCKMKRVLWTEGGDGYLTMWLSLMSGTEHLKMTKTVNFISCVFFHNLKKII